MSAENLVIVESPAKAKTIEKFLGKDFVVKSSYGHIRDLEKKKMGVDIENNFEPTYIIPEDKEKVIAELKKDAKKAKTVWLATDEDREGEAISWHICEVLKLNVETAKRIVFHEITPRAIKSAIEKPRTIDMNLVNAQQSRRILDRLVGFRLSPVLFKKVPSATALSAGRVQSVTVRLIVERERKIQNFSSTKSFKTDIIFSSEDQLSKKQLEFKASTKDFADKATAEQFLNECMGSDFVVEHIEVKEGNRTPAAPFTTSTLQQEGVRKLGYSVSRTMIIAQKLYEEGYITYMRTDSPTLSKEATDSIEKFVGEHYGQSYHHFRKYQAKSQSAQEAHEAIRPTDISRLKVPDSTHQALYDLIRKRTLASQMSNAKLELTNVDIGISRSKEKAKASGEIIIFDGFLRVYQEHKDDDNDSGDEDEKGFLPSLKKGQLLDLVKVQCREKFSKPESRYNEAGLVKQLEHLGIGRPSTYAPTIATIVKRGYVEKKSTDGDVRNVTVMTLKNSTIHVTQEEEKFGVEKNRLFPTELGILVNDFLAEHFQQIMDYKFTSKMEEDFDHIAEGTQVWTEVLKDFFNDFDKQVKIVDKTAERVSGERELGVDPMTQKMVKTRMGRYGPIVQLGETDENDKNAKAKIIKLLPHQQISTITLQEALELLSLPKKLGEFKGEKMELKLGPFGPYISHAKKFYSVPKAEGDIFKLSSQRAIELIQEKDERDANRVVKDFPKEKIQILNGRFGVYIKSEEGNHKIPKNLQEKAKNLTIDEVKELINHPPTTTKRRSFGRKKK